MARNAVALVTGILLFIGSQANAATDRTRLDRLIAQFEAADSNSDAARYRTLADQTLAEARRLYPAGHPEIAARALYVAQAMAASGKMDQAQAEVDRIVPLLAGAEGYRASWRNALSLRAYILNFKADHAGALAINEQLAAEYANDPSSYGIRDHAVTLSNLAASYLEHGRLDDALARNEEAIRIGLTLNPVPEDVAIWSANRVAYLYSAGRTENAIVTAQDGIARAGAALGPDHPAMANLYANLGAILLRLNRPHDAMVPIRQAYELIEKANGGPNQNSATMRTQFAQALVRAGRHADAIAYLDHATPIIDTQLGAQSDRSLTARDTRLIALIALGKGAEAEALARELLAVRDARLPDGHRDRANARDNLAKAAFALGNWNTAQDAAAQSVALRSKMLSADHPDLLLSRAFLLRVEDRGGLRPAAELVTQGRQVFETLVQNAQLARGSAQAERQRPAYGWLAEIFARHGASDDAFRAQQWAAHTTLEDTLAIAASERAAKADPALAKLLAQRRELVSARQGLEARVDANSARPDPAFDLVGVSRELAGNRREIAALDASLTPQQRDSLVFAPAAIAEIQATASRSDVSIMVTDIGNGWIVTAIGARSIKQHLVGPDAPVDDLVQQLRAVVSPASNGMLDRTASSRLFAVLFPDDAGALVRSARQLNVTANGVLGSLPFGLLSADRDGRVVLLEKMAIVRRVSMRGGKSAAFGQTGDTLIAFGGVKGAPAQSLMAMRSASTARAIADLPDLPDSRRELAALGQAIGAGSAQLLVGSEATEEALRQINVPTGAVLAFATHGLLSGELDGLSEPALLLSPDGNDDGLLKPSEIGTLQLPAGLVILSACNTAVGSTTNRPQLAGLVQGFFLAGADRVLASHWPVRDDAARRLSVGMVRGMKAGAPPAQALRRAIAAVRKGNDGEMPLDSPALWAVFELFEAN
ncbi:MAG: CHAT domain-containing protein [Novosphingobium sp.]|uniref:CHAT domain-containing tetratricopeptide repeat protein n=1 Tax=Novosphingobium sp. TaxID=1874826 RepID=UPI0027372C9F|nr:CHAT domain-containing protein [Novosphingobium sp.]MDP3550585.1 CHAT domain-containing protein [Novosphingobium sp.]